MQTKLKTSPQSLQTLLTFTTFTFLLTAHPIRSVRFHYKLLPHFLQATCGHFFAIIFTIIRRFFVV